LQCDSSAIGAVRDRPDGRVAHFPNAISVLAAFEGRGLRPGIGIAITDRGAVAASGRTLNTRHASPVAVARTRALAVAGGDGMDAALCVYLARYDIDVDMVRAQDQLHRRLAPGRFDVVLLDSPPPDEHRARLCLAIQQAVPDIPLIILSPDDDFSSRVAGLEMGADDCLPKPFEPRELVARIKAVLRRRMSPARTNCADRFESWVFDRTMRQLVMREGAVVPLSSYEARLLSVLIDHPWQVLRRERLLALANRSAREVTYRSVDLAISRLRAKIGDDAHQPTMIRTIRGEGYLFDVGPR
jgi:two-component system OmpR family response regulator